MAFIPFVYRRHNRNKPPKCLLVQQCFYLPYNLADKFLKAHPHLPVHYFNHDKNPGVGRRTKFFDQKSAIPYLLVLDDDIIFPESNGLEKIAALWGNPRYQHPETAVITLNSKLNLLIAHCSLPIAHQPSSGSL